MLALEVGGLRKWLIIIRLNLGTGPPVQVVANIQCETALCIATSQPYRLLVCVHVLLSITLPLVNVRLIPILETVQEVLSISKKSIGTPPRLCAEASKDPATLILND